jgi:hypothetical protein
MKFFKFEDALIGAETQEEAIEYYVDVVSEFGEYDAPEEISEDDARALVEIVDNDDGSKMDELEAGIADSEPFMITIPGLTN